VTVLLRNRCLALLVAIALLGLGSATPAHAILGLPIEVPTGTSGAKPGHKPATTPVVRQTVKPAITPAVRPAAKPATTPALTRATTSTATTTPSFAPPTASLRPHSRVSGRSTSGGKLSNTAIAAAALAALIALGCLLWGVARMRTFEPHWTLSLRHAIAEAGFRASATWAELSDWARLGH
jgi:hypothetical protein